MIGWWAEQDEQKGAAEAEELILCDFVNRLVRCLAFIVKILVNIACVLSVLVVKRVRTDLRFIDIV